MFGKATNNELQKKPSQEFEELCNSSNKRIHDLIVANNDLVETVRYWKHQAQELEVELDLIKAGAISQVEELQNRIKRLEKSVKR